MPSKTQYRLVVSNADFSESAEILTDSEPYAKTVLNLLRESGHQVGVFIETTETSTTVITTEQEWLVMMSSTLWARPKRGG